MRTPQELPRLSALALCLASACLLPACSSGGGSHADPPAAAPPPVAPPPPPPPPVSARSLELPPAPAAKPAPSAPAYNAGSTDVVRLVAAGSSESLGNVSTTGSLTKQGAGTLYLAGGVRFDGGTALQEGTLVSGFGSLFSNNLFSDVTISPGATFELTGDVIGDVVNNGILDPTEVSFDYGNFYDAEIFGDYTQGPEGLLRLLFGIEETRLATPLLTVTGTATLDGKVEFAPSGFVPAAGYLEWVLHAYGGVVGQFDSWSTRGPLFLTGALHYAPNDVYFLATQVSTQATMAAAGIGDALVLATAGRVDAAFGAGDAMAGVPAAALTVTQRQFLHSAAAIQRLDDFGRAAATFDSLSGHGHVDAAQSLLLQTLDEGPQAAAHAAALPSGAGGAWAQPTGWRANTGGAMAMQAGGYDHWLSDRWLLGSRIGWTSADLRFDRGGGSMHDRSPSWSLYLRRAGTDGAYLMADVGFSRHQLSLDRFIELGGGRGRVGSTVDMQASHAYLEAGREHALAGGRWSPYAALDYAALRGAGFTEAGNTGFELQVQDAFHQRLSGDAGLRYANDWRSDGDRWLQVRLDARYRRLLSATDHLRAAFSGAPDAEFDLLGLANSGDGVGLAADLLGGGEHWGWWFRYDRRASGQAVSMRLQRDFR